MKIIRYRRLRRSLRAPWRRGELPKGDARLCAAMALGVVLQTALHKAYGLLDGRMVDYAPTLKAAVMGVVMEGARASADKAA